MPKTTLVKCTLRWKSYISFLHYALINFNFKIPIKFTFLWKVTEMDSIYSSVGGTVEARGHTTLTSLNGVSFLMPLGLCMPIFNKKFRAVQRGAFGRFLDLPITKSKQACHKPVNKA